MQPESPPYRVTFTITADAAIDASRFMMARTRQWIIAGGLVVGVLGLVAAVLGDPTTGAALVVPGLLVLVLMVLKGPDRWLFNRRGRSVVGLSAELTIDEEGLDYKTPQGSGRVPWSALTEVRESPQTVLFVRDRILIAYAPADSFGSRARQRQIVEFARAQVASVPARTA